MNLESYLDTALKQGEYRIAECTIIGPYISAGFCTALLGRDQRSVRVRDRLTVLADDGWDPKQLVEIGKAHEESPGAARRRLTIARVRPNRGDDPNRRASIGLVHLKLLHLRLERRDGKYSKQVLLIGSANASEHGLAPA